MIDMIHILLIATISLFISSCDRGSEDDLSQENSELSEELREKERELRDSQKKLKEALKEKGVNEKDIHGLKEKVESMEAFLKSTGADVEKINKDAEKKAEVLDSVSEAINSKTLLTDGEMKQYINSISESDALAYLAVEKLLEEQRLLGEDLKKGALSPELDLKLKNISAIILKITDLGGRAAQAIEKIQNKGSLDEILSYVKSTKKSYDKIKSIGQDDFIDREKRSPLLYLLRLERGPLRKYLTQPLILTVTGSLPSFFRFASNDDLEAIYYHLVSGGEKDVFAPESVWYSLFAGKIKDILSESARKSGGFVPEDYTAFMKQVDMASDEFKAAKKKYDADAPALIKTEPDLAKNPTLAKLTSDRDNRQQKYEGFTRQLFPTTVLKGRLSGEFFGGGLPATKIGEIGVYTPPTKKAPTIVRKPVYQVPGPYIAASTGVVELLGDYIDFSGDFPGLTVANFISKLETLMPHKASALANCASTDPAFADNEGLKNNINAIYEKIDLIIKKHKISSTIFDTKRAQLGEFTMRTFTFFTFPDASKSDAGLAVKRAISIANNELLK